MNFKLDVLTLFRYIKLDVVMLHTVDFFFIKEMVILELSTLKLVLFFSLVKFPFIPDENLVSSIMNAESAETSSIFHSILA